MKNILLVLISIFSFARTLSAQSIQPVIKFGPLESTSAVFYGHSIACSASALGADIIIGSLGSGSDPSSVSGQELPGGELFNEQRFGDFGRAVVSLGDINNDSIADFVASSPDFHFIYLYKSIDQSTFNVTQISGTLAGAATFTGFGSSLSAISGYSNLAVGIPGYPNLSSPDGMVAFFDKNSGAFLHNCFGPGSSGDNFGQSIAWISDLDGDSVPELIVGSPDASPSGSAVGQVDVISGNSGPNCIKIPYLTKNSGLADKFGKAVAAVGDINGDGKEDFVAGGADADVMLSANGVAILISGADGSVLCDIRGNNDEGLGLSISGLGDVDLDGKIDFAVGAPDFNGGTGRVYIFNYDASNSACPIRFTIDGTNTFTSFGRALSSSATKAQQCDIDSDNSSELIVSSAGSSFGATSGAVFAYSFPTVTPTITPSPTNTPTVTPTFTPTPIPFFTATPTLTPTSNAVKPPVASTPERSRFNFRISENGNFVATNTFDSQKSKKKKNHKLSTSNCKVSLIARTSSQSLTSVSETKQIAYSKKASLITRFNGRGLNKTEKETSTDKHYILHVRAKNVCGDKVFYSNVASRYLNCGVEPKISIQQFTSDLANKIK